MANQVSLFTWAENSHMTGFCKERSR